MRETHRAHVQNGRLVLDEPSTLPEGTEVVLQVVPASLDDDEDDTDADDLDDEDRARLHEAIVASAQELDAGGGVPLDEILLELRRGP